MGFKEILEKVGGRNKLRKMKFREMEEDFRLQKMLEERQMSANERELRRFENEEREEQIKEALEFQRKQRQFDINHNHNPLDAPNITNHSDWSVLKEKNQFSNTKCMFSNQPMIHKSNKNLLKNNKKLFGI